MVLIEIKGTALDLLPPSFSPMFLVSSNPDGQNGMGTFTLTNDPEEAMKFISVGVAMEYWKRPSKIVPFRLDGQPNRPLTALTVEVIKIP